MDITCLLAALLFFTANLLLIIFYGFEKNREHFDYESFVTLDPSAIQMEWEWRISNKPQFLAAGIINGLAWLFFAFPMIQLTWILSHRGSNSLWLHIAIGLLVLAGSFTEWISRFLYIGATMATELMATEFNLDDWAYSGSGIGWRTLEVTHLAITGLITFVDAFEWIALFFIMSFVHISVRRWRVEDTNTFGACWNVLGLFIAMLSLCDFIAEIFRLSGSMVFSDIAFWYSGVNRLILMPLWLFILGCRLPAAKERVKELDPQSVINDHIANGATTNGTSPTHAPQSENELT